MVHPGSDSCENDKEQLSELEPTPKVSGTPDQLLQGAESSQEIIGRGSNGASNIWRVQ